MAVDGRQDPACQRSGFFLGTSLLDRVEPGMRCYRDEIFGPVLSVVRADTYDRALRIINENPYGNGVAIFTRDGAPPGNSNSTGCGDGGGERGDPVPVAYYASGDGKRPSSATCTSTVPKECSSTRAPKLLPAAGQIRAPVPVDLGFPQSR